MERERHLKTFLFLNDYVLYIVFYIIIHIFAAVLLPLLTE
ncbi:hypothetical protein BACEGG_03490 [Bacteroides eggerthii DSM 20697]|nr:hypothetical protein BACEGG_03490 [Bacteroides eggerthii DSM 20697]